MKIAVVGGGSTYTPELVDGIGRLRDALPVDELVLVDRGADRLELVAGVGQRILSSVSKHLVGRFFVALRKEVETAAEGAA